MSKGLNFVAFALGAAIGSFVTWKLVKSKYEKLANDELQSMRERFSYREPSFKQEVNEVTHDDALRQEYEKFAEGYSSDAIKTTEKGDADDAKNPRIISPDQFGEIYEYDLVNLTYYADDILVYDDTDDKVDDIENTVGEDFAEHFGEYEDDSVHIRNDELMIDYEILLDPRKYSDILRERSHLSVK